MHRREFLQCGLAFPASLAAALSVEAGASAAPHASSLRGLPGRVVHPGAADYDAARQGYNARIDHSPAAVAFCATAHEVSRALRWARARRMPLRARCGRHSYEGYSCLDDGLVIDVSPMRQIWVDPNGRDPHVKDDARQAVAHVGAGVRLLDLYETLWHAGVTVPGGSCATVGIAGLTLGGGYGLLARRYGLTCDHLVGLTLVTAEGRVRRVDANHYPDLFWACRGGGGGNYGIATSFTFRVQPVDTVTIYNITWDASALEKVLGVWQRWAPTVDDRLTSILKLRAIKKDTIVSTGQFVGTAGELSSLLNPLKAAAPPSGIALETVSYINAVRIFAGLKLDFRRWQNYAPTADGQNAALRHTRFKGASDYAAGPLPADAMATIRRFLQSAPAEGDLLQLENYGGAISQVAADATAFPHRARTRFGMQYQAYWSQRMPADRSLAWVRDFRQAMQPWVTGGAYANYADADLADAPRAYYGENLTRLRQIKAKYDPHRTFDFPQSV